VLRVSTTGATKQTSRKMIKKPLQINDARQSAAKNSKGGNLLKKLPDLRLINTHLKTDITFIQITLNYH